MKRLFLQLSFLLIASAMAMAGPVTREQALQEASKFINKHPRMANAKGLRSVPSARQQLKDAESLSTGYYAFNVGEQQGFVLVSADDRTPAVIGYAESGSFDYEKMPENMRWWLGEYERQLRQLDKNPTVKASSTKRESIEPLISTKWGQGDPYYNMCPLDVWNNKPCITGCVATAMAQVMNYHKYPEQTIATIPGYTTRAREIPISDIDKTTIDWDNMLNEYGYSASASQKDAIANLMFLCGVSVQMNYTSKSSGTSSFYIPSALVNYFGYDDGIQFVVRDNYTYTEWNDMIYNELSHKRPVLYGGSESPNSAHEFVVDGYSENDYFHVNWGWSGWCDTYFLLSLLNYDNVNGGVSNTTIGFSYFQDAIIGIQPPTGSSTTTDRLKCNNLFVDSEYTLSIWERDNDGAVTIPFVMSLSNTAMMQQTFETGMGLFDVNGQMIESFTLHEQTFGPLESFLFRFKWTFAKGLADGEYTIKSISRQNGSEQWLEDICSSKWSIIVSVENTEIKLIDYFYYLNATIECVTKHPVVNNPVLIRATIENEGSFFNEPVYLGEDGYFIAGLICEIDRGKSAIVDFVYKPSEIGKHKIELYRKRSDDYVPLTNSPIVIDVQAQPTVDLSVQASIEGLNSKGILDRSTANVTFDLTNNSSIDFDGGLYGVLYRIDEEEGRIQEQVSRRNVSLASGTSGQAEMVFNDLKDGSLYILTYYYSMDGKDYTDEDYEIRLTVKTEADQTKDMTEKVVNPDFEMDDYGWTVYADPDWGSNVGVGGVLGNLCFEAWNNAGFDIYQELNDLPVGVYEIKVQGFYRYLRDDEAWNVYHNAGENTTAPAYVYMNNSSKPLKNVFDESASADFYIGGFYTEPSGEYTFPNDMATSAQAFSAGMYAQSAYGLVTTEGETVRIGVKGITNQGNDSWAIWDNFQLIYHGYQANTIEPVLEKAIADAKRAMVLTMGRTEYDHLFDVVQKAEEAYNGTDGQQMFNMLSVLYEAQNAAQTSAGNFQALTDGLDQLRWDIEHFNVAEEADVDEAWLFYRTTLASAKDHRYDEGDIPSLLNRTGDMSWKVRMPKNMADATEKTPVECTSLLFYPSFEKDGKNIFQGWSCDGPYHWGNDVTQHKALAIEFYQAEFDMFQELTELPKGKYRFTAPAFYRYGSAQNDYSLYSSGEKQNHAYIYMSNGTITQQTPMYFNSAFAMSEKQGHGEEVQVGGLWVPNDMVSSVYYFSQGKYLNECTINVEDGYLKVGATKTGILAYDWVMMDDFRLYYLGDGEPGPEPLKGDLNDDGDVNGADIAVIVNMVLGIRPLNDLSDVNGDKEVNGADIASEVNIVLGKDQSRQMGFGEDIDNGDVLFMPAIADSKLLINVENPEQELTLIQFDVTVPDGMDINSFLFNKGDRVSPLTHTLSMSQLNDNTKRVLLWSGTNATFTGNKGSLLQINLSPSVIGEYEGELMLDNILLVGPDMKQFKPGRCVLQMKGSTGIVDVSKSLQRSDIIFSPSGIRLQMPQKGLNIVNGKKVIY